MEREPAMVPERASERAVVVGANRAEADKRRLAANPKALRWRRVAARPGLVIPRGWTRRGTKIRRDRRDRETPGRPLPREARILPGRARLVEERASRVSREKAPGRVETGLQ
jgi:hypothetical protein